MRLLVKGMGSGKRIGWCPVARTSRGKQTPAYSAAKTRIALHSEDDDDARVPHMDVNLLTFAQAKM